MARLKSVAQANRQGSESEEGIFLIALFTGILKDSDRGI